MMMKILLSMLLAVVSSDNIWDNYKVGDTDVISVTGQKNYDKVVVFLHGGGQSGEAMAYLIKQGLITNLNGVKYAFPTSPFGDEKTGFVWYYNYKLPDCGLLDDCAYNLTSIAYAASKVAAVLKYERKLLGGDSTKVFLAGFSQGAQMTTFVQICNLDFALGGVIAMSGFPLPPLVDMPGATPEAAKKNATYYGTDMKWMFYHGSADPIFPVDLMFKTVHGIWEVLGIEATLKIQHTQDGMGHTLTKSEMDMLDKFIQE